ncbi:uncharacterized protein PV09_06787 [Verruconis gallopava]|uniref:Uncharacterized protein n=1 Tax=Verruconis gallopava TaxID=253628 RepID=A0A0D2A5Z2_9PEZI|nr:uncharacterized protein PV09_06787 [Verruconis gallopava]KIW01950.1 hypothetical protein PV09_06787 [Verruconis gallopava]
MSSTIGNPLSAGSLSTIMAKSLPSGASIENAFEAIALAVHSGMIAVGFRLKGLGEDHRIQASADSDAPQQLPAEWKASSNYVFRYSHPQSSMEFVVKVGRLGSKATVDAIAIGDDKRASFDITAYDYVSRSNLPSNPMTDSTKEEESKQKLLDVFISAGRLSDLGSLLKLKIIQKVAPGISKEGYEEENTASPSQRRDPNETGEPNLREPQHPSYNPLHDPQFHNPPTRPHPFNDPNIPQPSRPPVPPGLEPPGFEDEYDILRQPGGRRGPPRNPLSIGHDDLYPAGLGPHDPIYGGGVGPMRGGLGGSGGMHPTFDDPIFGGGQGERRGDPQVPGGARYDPVYPGDPRGGPGHFPGAGHRGPFGGGGSSNPFGGFGGGDFI